MANLSADQIIEMGKKRGIDMSKYEGRIRQKMASGMANVPDEVINFRGQPQRTQQPEMPMRQSRGIVPDLLDKINPSGALSTTVGRAAQGFMAGLGISAADNMSDDYSKLYAQEAIKSRFEDPTVRQLREAEIKSLETPPPPGILRIGKQLVQDPSFVKPKEQAEMDEESRTRDAEVESIRSMAEQNLQSIKKSKEGATRSGTKFFGPLGNLPSIAAPSSLLGFGDYSDRKEWENNINQLLSQKVVDLISEMKRVSKTGATGFGQLSEKEGTILREASTALSKDLPADKALFYLNEMEKINKRILESGVGSSERTDEFSKMSDEELRQIASGQ